MKQNRIKIEYDRESRVLSVVLGSAKSVDSDIDGNVVIDYDRNGNIVRINLYRFSLGEFREGAPRLKRFAREQHAPLSVR